MSRGSRGPKGWQLFLGTSVVIFWGFSRLGAGNQKRSEQRLYERQERYALVPLLQNEADREYLMREKKLKEQEKNIMSQVPGWNAGESQYYKNSRWTPAHVMDSMKSNQKK
jgi:NADH dehydrogenase (ubiquinone) 1 alpha subcomplex subunit 13